ncbi:hypothetical protein ACFOOM_07180 [Streptomyces echinoruber]|uniref:Uncharacterized protein n=1 Tax=Streptomyces echinoruber TaxID=68898 RepID=A0A918QZ70_9ACTN|nr:hypothetical protein [Streptomyces echinoruber]GGZ79743.1 hypothetical protein GCM10010389_16740 [Streptomyces echinoruber]
MGRGEDTTAAHRWINKEFSSDVPPAKRAFAAALQELCRHLAPAKSSGQPAKAPTQAEAARHVNCSESSLSRFLSGQYVPRPESVEHIYKKACTDAGGEDRLSISLDELLELRERAEAERCHSCVELKTDMESLNKQLQEAQADRAGLQEAVAAGAAEVEALRREVAELRAAVAKLTAAKAGLQARLVARAASAPLPVPRRRGDRQRSNEKRDVAAARQVARRAGELHNGGSQATALTLLRHTTDVLSPMEVASLFRQLREHQQDKLADNLLYIYGRDRQDHDVLRVALELHEQGAPKDAGTLLQAAVE